MFFDRSEPEYTTGKVTSVNVKGYGQNSAQFLFTVENYLDMKNRAFVVRTLPTHEPQVFVSMTALVTAAYYNDDSIGVWSIPQDRGDVSHAYEIEIPPKMSKKAPSKKK